MPNGIDIHENHIQSFSPEVLELLLADHTSGGRILWATHDYEALGPEYAYRAEIQPRLITGEHGMVIRPRVVKSREEQAGRVRGMAEVFTPAWVVRKMVDALDIAVNTRCLELTCGEAPFLTSRYDATTGTPIAIADRVGMLNRKLRLIDGQQLADDEWLAQIRLAFQTTYGYEWQGDSLLLARENLLYTFIDHYEARHGKAPTVRLLKEFATIISWNLWQMDGLSYRTPREKSDEQPTEQTSLFANTPTEASPPFCLINDWQKRKTIKVIEIKNNHTMKFDVIIGNPPYQEERTGDNKQFAPPIYNYFLDEAHKLGDIVEMIHPARFLFNAGSTPKDWNEKMLSDNHIKILHYENDSSKIFSGTSIAGGLAVSFRDNSQVFSPIRTFTIFPELNSILQKVIKESEYRSLVEIIDIQTRFNLNTLLNEYPKYKEATGNGKDNRLEKNIFEKVSLFTNEASNSDDIKILGIYNRSREWRYINQRFIDTSQSCLYKYKVVVSVSNGGAGNLGEQPVRIIGEPLIEKPGEGYTRTFISIGAFNTQIEAENCSKYLLSRFARLMVGILKTTQMINRDVWKYVPLQDFTSNSDIDWSKSIDEIDEQLFDKYGLDDKEREFIRTKVKEMK